MVLNAHSTAHLLRPHPVSALAQLHAFSSEMPSGLLLTLLPCSISCPWVYLSASLLGRCHKLSTFWLDMGWGCTEEASPNLSLPPRAWHIQQPPPPPPAVPITPTSGALVAGLSAAQGGDLHVSTNIYAHPGSSTPTFLGWPFTPGSETGPLSGWICMCVYFWVGSQLGESERKLLRETVGSSDVPLLTCSIHQFYPTTPISDLRLPVWIPAPWMYTFPPPWVRTKGKNGSCSSLD